jgi:anti-anti-sigma factor
MELNFSVEVPELREGEYALIRVAGEIDVYTCPLFKQALQEIANCQLIEVDFEKVIFIDSGGFGAFLGLARRHRVLHQHSGEIRLLNPSPQIQKDFRKLKLSSMIKVQGLEDDYLGRS